MKHFLAPFLCLTLLTAVFTGCSSPNITEGLKVELTRIARSDDGSVQVSWRLMNPNIVSYLVAQTNHRIYLNGTLIGTVEDKDAVAMPAQTNVDRISRLAPGGSAGTQAVNEALSAGSAAYRTETSIIVRLYGETTDKSSLSSRGTVPVVKK